METVSEGQFGRLPDGQRIRIEAVHADGYVSGRRVEGEHAGTVVVCAITKLEPDSENYDSENSCFD